MPARRAATWIMPPSTSALPLATATKGLLGAATAAAFASASFLALAWLEAMKAPPPSRATAATTAILMRFDFTKASMV